MIYKIWSRFLAWISDIMISTSPPNIKAKHIRELTNKVLPGDIVCRKTYYLDAYFIKGEYSHSGFVISDQDMIHAVSEGVEKIDILDFVKDSDGFILLRPEYKNVDKCIDYAKEQIGKPYDFLFSRKDDSRLYCHELTSRILNQDNIKIEPEHDIIYANDFIRNFSKILECP